MKFQVVVNTNTNYNFSNKKSLNHNIYHHFINFKISLTLDRKKKKCERLLVIEPHTIYFVNKFDNLYLEL